MKRENPNEQGSALARAADPRPRRALVSSRSIRRRRRSTSASTCGRHAPVASGSTPTTRCAPRSTRTWSGLRQRVDRRRAWRPPPLTAPRDTTFEVTGVPADQDERGRQGARNDFLPGWDWNRSGERLVFAMTAPNVKSIREQAVQQALQTIRNRIDEFGVSEPTIARQGMDSDRIVVQLPGVDDPERVKRLIKNTAFLEFRLVDFPPAGADGVGYPRGRAPALRRAAARQPRDPRQATCATARAARSASASTPSRRGASSPAATSRTRAPGIGQFNEPVVHVPLSAEGAELFGDADRRQRRPRPRHRPRRQGRVGAGDQLAASPTRASSRATSPSRRSRTWSTVLRSGALPAGITYLEERTVGPSLGRGLDRRRPARRRSSARVLVVLCMLIVYQLQRRQRRGGAGAQHAC